MINNFTEENWCFNPDHTIKRVEYEGEGIEKQECQVWVRETYSYNKDTVENLSEMGLTEKSMHRAIPKGHNRSVTYCVYPLVNEKDNIRLRTYITI